MLFLSSVVSRIHIVHTYILGQAHIHKTLYNIFKTLPSQWMNELNVMHFPHMVSQQGIFLQSSEKAESASHTLVTLMSGLGVKGHPLITAPWILLSLLKRDFTCMCLCVWGHKTASCWAAQAGLGTKGPISPLRQEQQTFLTAEFAIPLGPLWILIAYF